MAEVRIQAEGALAFALASGTAYAAWGTASGGATGIFAYVDSFSFTSGSQITTISDRNIPKHHKETMKDPIPVTFNLKWTGHVPTGVSGGGTTVPLINLEFKASAPEVGSATWYQFHYCPINNLQFTENADGDTMQYTTNALSMIAATGSGYVIA